MCKPRAASATLLHVSCIYPQNMEYKLWSITFHYTHKNYWGPTVVNDYTAWSHSPAPSLPLPPPPESLSWTAHSAPDMLQEDSLWLSWWWELPSCCHGDGNFPQHGFKPCATLKHLYYVKTFFKKKSDLKCCHLIIICTFPEREAEVCS